MGTEITESTPSPARQTIASLKEAIEAGKSASIAQVVRVIEELTTKADTVSVEQLAELISQDLATVARIVSVANTIGFNPTATEVTSVVQAIHTVGFERIRNLAVALLLLENAEAGGGGNQAQSVAALALASGLVAQTLVEKTSTGDPDQAFVCAALRNYGRLLLAHFLPDRYREAQTLAVKSGWETACREVFGLTALNVSHELLAFSQVPKAIVNTVRPLPANIATAATLSPQDRLVAAAEFSTRLCELIEARALNIGEISSQAANLAKQFGKTFRLDAKAFEEILRAVGQRITVFGGSRGLRTNSSPLIHRLSALAGTEKLLDRPTAPPPTKSEMQILAETTAALRQLAAATPPDFKQALTLVVGALQGCLCLTECAVFLRDDILPMLAARIGYGPLFDQVRDQLLLNPDTQDVFNICLKRGEDVLIANPADPKLRAFIPEWLRGSLDQHTLILLPLRHGATTLGVICGIGKDEHSLERVSRFNEALKLMRTELMRVNLKQAA